jgi:hypothetical protein
MNNAREGQEMTEATRQQWTMWTPFVGPEPMPVASEAAPRALVHCGAPMVARSLDYDPRCAHRNDAVLEAALHGACLYACACGFLTEVPTGGPELLADPADAALFQPLFARRVLAAAGRVETAQWTLDQAQDVAGPTGTTDGAGEAAVEVACWALDQATTALGAELALAARHGTPLDVLAQAAGIPLEEVTALLKVTTTAGPRPEELAVAA